MTVTGGGVKGAKTSSARNATTNSDSIAVMKAVLLPVSERLPH